MYAPYSNQLRDINPIGWFARYVAIHVREVNYVKIKTISFVKNSHAHVAIRTKSSTVVLALSMLFLIVTYRNLWHLTRYHLRMRDIAGVGKQTETQSQSCEGTFYCRANSHTQHRRSPPNSFFVKYCL